MHAHPYIPPIPPAHLNLPCGVWGVRGVGMGGGWGVGVRAGEHAGGAFFAPAGMRTLPYGNAGCAVMPAVPGKVYLLASTCLFFYKSASSVPAEKLFLK